MARSTNIYYIRRICDQKVLGTATVKHEIHSLLQRNNSKVPQETVELVRFRDGWLDERTVIPWEFKCA